MSKRINPLVRKTAPHKFCHGGSPDISHNPIAIIQEKITIPAVNKLPQKCARRSKLSGFDFRNNVVNMLAAKPNTIINLEGTLSRSIPGSLAIHWFGGK